MILDNKTIEPALKSWSALCANSWTDEEKNKVSEAIQALSGYVTPHVVLDMEIPKAAIQEILLMRVIDLLEDWLRRTAAELRRAFGISATRYSEGVAKVALSLRSATTEELVALPGVDKKLARDIRQFCAEYQSGDSIDSLLDIEGIGAERLAQLRKLCYFETPRTFLTSPTTWAFATYPSIATFVGVLERTDLEFFFGDQNTVERRLNTMGGSTVERFNRFIRTMTEQASTTTSVVDGILASDGKQRLARHEKQKKLLSSAVTASGEILINEAYVPTVKKIIDGATTNLDLMVFLATASANLKEDFGSLQLIEAMEKAAARGVEVRVILDQDDGGEPYKSFWINQPLVQRFKERGVKVRFDEKDTLLHSKVLVTDTKTVVVGSHNWTRTSFNESHEISLLLQSSAVAREFEDRFQALWSRLPDIS